MTKEEAYQKYAVACADIGELEIAIEAARFKIGELESKKEKKLIYAKNSRIDWQNSIDVEAKAAQDPAAEAEAAIAGHA